MTPVLARGHRLQHSSSWEVCDTEKHIALPQGCSGSFSSSTEWDGLVCHVCTWHDLENKIEHRYLTFFLLSMGESAAKQINNTSKLHSILLLPSSSVSRAQSLDDSLGLKLQKHLLLQIVSHLQKISKITSCQTFSLAQLLLRKFLLLMTVSAQKQETPAHRAIL